MGTNLTIFLQSVNALASNPFHRSPSHEGNSLQQSFKLENVSPSTTLYELKEIIEKMKGLKPDQQMIQNLRQTIMSAGGRGSVDGSHYALSDEKTLGELGLVSAEKALEPIILKVMFDMNPIIIRVNLSHSMHQPKPSGSGAGYHNQRLFDTSGYSSAGWPN